MFRNILLVATALITFPNAAVSVEASVDEAIKADCKAQWPSDYRMQEFCIETQAEANVAMFKVYKSDLNQEEKGILAACLDQWETKNGQDWAMVKFCYDEQHAAYTRLKN